MKSLYSILCTKKQKSRNHNDNRKYFSAPHWNPGSRSGNGPDDKDHLLGSHHKIHIYLEYNSVCPLVRSGTSPPPSPQARKSPPPQNQRGDTLACRWRGGGSQYGRLGEKPSTLSTLWFTSSIRRHRHIVIVKCRHQQNKWYGLATYCSAIHHIQLDDGILSLYLSQRLLLETEGKCCLF